jgi:hypothetical protein
MLLNYESLMELRAAWASLEGNARPRTTVLVLDQNFAGHLPSLIRRDRPQRRLIIAAAEGALPHLAIGELARGEAAGWSEIWCADDWRRAVDDAQRSLADGEELALFWPSWREMKRAPQRSRGAGTIGESARRGSGGSLYSLRVSVA